MKHLILLAFIAIALSSCNQQRKEQACKTMVLSDIKLDETPPKYAPPPLIDNSNDAIPSVKKIIKDGSMEIIVDNLDNTKAAIDALVKKHNAYYDKEELTNYTFRQSYELAIRIPANRFEAFIAAVESGNGKVQTKRISARDVTEEYFDLQTRLTNKNSYVARYRELLKQAKSIDDIMAIQEKIRVLEQEIDTTTGRLKYLADQVDFSSLSLTLTKEIDDSSSNNQWSTLPQRLVQSLDKGWNGFVDFLFFMIKTWPLWLILSITLYYWRKFRKRKKTKSDNK
jgi:hypothetical protein